MKAESITTSAKIETAVLVAVSTRQQRPEQTEEYLDELEFLATTAGAITKAKFVQNLDHPDKRTYVGSGKLEEIEAYVTAYDIDMVIFDDDLSPSQVRNLENHFQCKILDRSLLILNIFSIRAQTAQAKVQVELAQYQYVLPRLTRMWTHLQKQKGGVGMRGPGETELETDRRIIKHRISLLKDKLSKIDKQSQTRRQNRDRMVRAALVGYTNVGKSTLMQAVAKADVFAENKLFATVDSTVRKVVIDRIPFLLTDTVGFIRKLPTTLIECFKSTLDEIREADVLIHVVDISHASFEEHIDVVKRTLAEIGVTDKPTVLVFNKIDLYEKQLRREAHERRMLEEMGQAPDYEEEPQEDLIERLKRTYHGKDAQTTVFISASKKKNMDEFKKEVLRKVRERHFEIFPNYEKEDWEWGGNFDLS
ncbi:MULTISPECIES: GTPase HflX [Persicobacter]|uniref:GTPase HflX n=1 Tax=Persicobacter diffluens TaxID=981 RepID=A0AAN5AIG2_9BACT|nr:GTPase HflX [Persicobacter sp. CCB-QB2]GJM59874.1 GTPase HflX [Persicobacter diffluens]